MSINSNIPQIAELRSRVEDRFGKRLSVHSDFVSLVAVIEMELRQHISESTLERVWGYSTRGYDTVSLRTLDVLSRYANGCDWRSFCELLAQEGVCESEFFDDEIINSSELEIGDRLRIGWFPDRLCELSYLGENCFVAEMCENSKLQVGDTFSCSRFVLGKPLIMSDLKQGNSARSQTYVVGRKNGLTILKKL
jgi:hypothetical protein